MKNLSLPSSRSYRPELEGYRQDLASKGYNGITDEDVLTYAMFPEVAINFFDANRLNLKSKKRIP